MSPNKNRLDLLDELIDDFQVDGVVDLVLQACHKWKAIKKLVKDKKGIPYTVVETDYSQADIEQIKRKALKWYKICNHCPKRITSIMEVFNC